MTSLTNQNQLMIMCQSLKQNNYWEEELPGSGKEEDQANCPTLD